MVLTYATLIEGRTPEQLVDFDAYLEGRELPSQIKAKQEQVERRQELLKDPASFGGEIG